MARIFITLLVMSLGTLGCTQRELPDTPAAAPSQADGGLPAIGQGIAGRVVDDRGQPVARALVVPKSLDSNSPAIPELAVLSDANGQYAWRLPAGRYELTVSVDGFQAATLPATVSASQVTTLDFTLQRTR